MRRTGVIDSLSCHLCLPSLSVRHDITRLTFVRPGMKEGGRDGSEGVTKVIRQRRLRQSLIPQDMEGTQMRKKEGRREGKKEGREEGGREPSLDSCSHKVIAAE